MLCRCDLNDLWLISSRTCFYFVLLPVELKSNRTWNRRITAYYSTRIFLYFTVIACVNISCLCTSLVHFCGKPDLIGDCPFWHTAIWQIDIIIVVVYYNASYNNVSAGRCSLLSGRNRVILSTVYCGRPTANDYPYLINSQSISFASFPEPGHITAIIRPGIWL